MKKFIALVFVAMMGLTFAACEKDSNDDNNEKVTSLVGTTWAYSGEIKDAAIPMFNEDEADYSELPFEVIDGVAKMDIKYDIALNFETETTGTVDSKIFIISNGRTIDFEDLFGSGDEMDLDEEDDDDSFTYTWDAEKGTGVIAIPADYEDEEDGVIPFTIKGNNLIFKTSDYAGNDAQLFASQMPKEIVLIKK